jgi:hypothetical protein
VVLAIPGATEAGLADPLVRGSPTVAFAVAFVITVPVNGWLIAHEVTPSCRDTTATSAREHRASLGPRVPVDPGPPVGGNRRGNRAVPTTSPRTRYVEHSRLPEGR